MTNNFSIKSLLLTAIFCFVAAGSVIAQSQGGSGQITGTVTDSAGAVVPSATVTLTSQATNQTQTVTSSGDGLYRFVLLQPGNYTIKASASNFAEQSLDVEVQVGRTTDANFTLGASNVSAVVEVTADGVQTTSSNFDSVQDSTAIQNLPINGRRFQDFVTLTPSAQVETSRGQISLSGQRGINGNINVDGVDYNQPFFGGIRGGERANQAFTLPQEAIREFQVVAAGYSAEYGRSSGGIVNAVTKSGDNNLRGSLFYLWRPEQLARANEYAQALADQRLNALGLDATLAPTQHQFGGSISGPIAKDRLFYFASYEQQKFEAPRQVLFGNISTFVPTATQTEGFNFYRNEEAQFTQTNNAYAAFGKVDWNINDSNRFNIRYNYSRNNAGNAAATGETALDPTTNNSLSTNGTEKNRNNIVVAQLITNFTPTVVNEARFQFAREDRPRISNAEVANINTSIGIYGTRNFLPTTQFDKRYQVTDSLTVITGNHTIKFGGEYSDIFVDQKFGFNQFGVFTFAGLTATGGILDAIGNTPNLTNPTPSLRYFGRFDTTTARYNKQIGNLTAAFGVKELAFYATDSWTAIPNRLTVNFGLRYEKQFNPTAEANNNPVITLVENTVFPLAGGRINVTDIPDSQNQWGPRIGFAWNPFGDGKTVIRGFSGVYYARTPLIVLAAPFNNFRDPAGDLSVTIGSPAFSATGFNQATFDTQNPQYVSIVGAGVTPNTVFRQFAILGINLNSSALTSLPVLSPAQLSTIANAIRNATTNPPASLGVYQNANFIGITDDYRNPQSFQFGGGVEHQLADGLVVGADYSQVNTIYLQRNRDINLPAPTGVDLVTGRVLVNRNSRPLTQIGTIQLRDSSGRSVYRGLTFRANLRRKWGQVNAFYTLSKNMSDDDNERDAGGVLYDNPYNLSGEFGRSRLDRRHQFVANPVFFLPAGFEVSSTMRFLSGLPVNARVGSDANGDGNTNERPFLAPSYEIVRNFYNGRPFYQIDLRVQKGFSFGERQRLIFTSEFFNVLNASNIDVTSTTSTNFCSNTASNCGLAGVTNPTFLQVRDGSGNIILANTPRSQVFQMQLGARFVF
ncbi:MAG: carboxypeptidase regulatory-like domain-containing protein [Blastocatellia bacterium]